MNRGILECFPSLPADAEIHMTPDGGTLFSGLTPVPLHAMEASFLSQCDGRRRLSDILPTSSNTSDQASFLFFTAQLMKDDFLILSGSPSPRDIRVTGSRRAYIPPHMSIELTAGCNLRCRHCYRESGPNRDDGLATGRLIEILEELAHAGLRSVELTGGEPTFRRDFDLILSTCVDRFGLVGLLTNGTLINQDRAERLAAARERLFVSISLDGCTEEAHDLRRGVRGSFRRSCRSIERLAALGVNVRVAMCVDEGNYADIESTLLLAKRLGAVAFSYTPVLPLGRGKEWASLGWGLDGREVWRAEQSLAERYKGFLATMAIDASGQVNGADSCGAGYRTCAMDPMGRIRPCPTFGPNEFVLGNLADQSIEEVFSHPIAFSMARLQWPTPKVCGDCSIALFCAFCPLRGMRGREEVTECKWAQLPTTGSFLSFAGSSAMERPT